MSDKPDMWNDFAVQAEDLNAMPHENTYAGVASFLRRPYRKDLTEAEVAVVGVPFDTATTNRPGTRFGPRGIRAASTDLAFEQHIYGWGFHPVSELKIVDHGDIPIDFNRPETVPDQIENYVAWMVSQDVKVLSLGGDHFITWPLLKAHATKYGKPLSLIHFDAHSDTWADEHEDGINHGTMFWHAARQGFVDPKTSAQIGLRTVNFDTMGFNIFDAPFVHEHGVGRVIEEVRRIVGDNPVYLTFDIDCLDPAFAPGTGTPVCGGLSNAQAMAIVKGLQGINLIGADLVEVSPPYDHAEITALAGATLALSFLGLFARAPKGGA